MKTSLRKPRSERIRLLLLARGTARLLLFFGLCCFIGTQVWGQACPATDYNVVSNKQMIVFSTTMPMGDANFADFQDGVGGNQQAIWWQRNNNVAGQEVLKMVFPAPTVLTGFETTGSFFLDNGVNYRIEGSNNGSTWTDLTGTQVFSTTKTAPAYGAGENSYKFPVTGNETAYTQYRIYGLSGQTDWNWVSEIYLATAPASAGLSNISCTYGADTGNPNDDEVTFDLNPLLVSASGNYNVTSNVGTPTPSSGTLGTTTSFVLPPGSVGAGDITLTITDGGAGCTVTEIIPNVPAEPFVDTDGDSVGDKEDLDADNDGILNTVEDSYCADAACDPDNDGLPNYLDLDSDGDGIPDNVEAQSTTGYVAPNGDSPATYAGNDGVNTAYAGGLALTDTDSDGTPDFIDTDSDGDYLTDAEESGLPVTGMAAPNGLDMGVKTSNDYSDVNGVVNNPDTDLAKVTTTTTEVDYRDKKPPTIVKVCYNSDQYGISGSWLTWADEKLTNLNNWGPDGIDSRYQFELFSFGTGAITEAALIANGCQIFYAGGTNTDAGNFNPGTTSTFSAADKDAIKSWAQSPNNVVIAFQGFSAFLGGPDYAGSSGNANPNSLTPLGEVVISGLFGQTMGFNQGGGFQGKFTAFPSTACVITQDNNGNPTGLLNGTTGDFYFADYDMLSELSTLSNNNGISTQTDIFFANLFSSAAMVAIEGPANACNAFLCPAGDQAPVLTSTTVSSSGTPVDLPALFTGAPPTGATLTWHNTSPVADENYIGNAANYTESGVVYAAFRAADGSCYSPATPVMVTVNYPDLAVTVSPDSETSAAGQTQSFTVTVTNNGPIDAPEALVKIPIPAARQLILANPSAGAYSGATQIWNVGQLNAGQSATLAITLRLQ